MQQKLENIKFVITDVDGVLTDGQLHYDANGEAIKSFHVRDGLGIKMLMDAGIQVAVLSGRDSPILRRRIADLGIKLYFLGKLEKETACFDLMKQAGVTADQTAYIGDDSVDLPAFAACGTSFTVADAPIYVKNAVDHVLSTNGGKGAFREMSDMILQAQGKSSVFDTAQGFLKSVKNMGQ
ncbi:3-deoxy-D-manno-octulosonate 8-phosphate phosphatase KdsC [Haemophilus influenzae]|uniref:KdsC family phosphatase n=1 Tax=Haemophilus influenzae TaxID=727 RepID=UPI0001545828|nr:HAD family hydrolase [Haemophilus influenzae]ABQ98152.1 3-deoxy-D-manno-octulosonate 8-phosphate phosphatase [Haemophilus influenzae PittEE]AVI96815.1 hydrolase, HAD super, subfamily III A [Haemophilus influenzae]AVI98588.1 hydrolase, HAD super, subfamily III A [Haemophilus influenzae]AVJ07607.1 hydrolase, HAD super, subfamily III A [Haemophilus influenzae]AVJ09442.1 hydrolase, HAD super, subfamily III A [Haemophilus influenzae]